MDDQTSAPAEAGTESGALFSPDSRRLPVVYREVAQLWSLDLRTGLVTTSSDRAAAPVVMPKEDWLDDIHPENRASVDTLLAALTAKPEREIGVKLRLRRGADYRLLDLRCRGLRLGGDDVELIHGALTPLTPAFDPLAYPAQKREDVEFRIKAIISMVRSLARRSLETSESVDDFAASFDGRLSAMSDVQLMLTRSDDGLVDLETLVRQDLKRTASMEADKADISGPRVRLPARTAEMLALTIHELGVNALKFGALADEDASLDICWKVDASANRLVFEWTELGVIITAAPKHQGFGSELIEAGLPYELDAETRLDFRPDGVRCEISLPWPATA